MKITSPPSAILFDYGHTLVNESSFDSLAGYRALMKYAVRNPHNVTPEQAAEYGSEMFGYLMREVHEADAEINHRIFFRTLFERFGLGFDISPLEQELIYWQNASTVQPMPGAVELIDYLNQKGMPTGVVSNLSFSGEALHYRLRSVFPRERFCFVMASSDYGWRKPSKFFFNAAVANIGEKPENIMFCGDHPRADIMGAAGVGMVPVWVQSPLACSYRDNSQDKAPDADHLHLHSISELIDIIEALV